VASPSVTWTFTNATTADATQVNTNFTDLINGASDGTKDYSINTLTLAGNLTVNGNTTIGSASGDTLTFNASIASSIPVSANDTYDFGSATLAMRSFYVGNGTKSVRIIAGVITTSYSLTLPVAVPTLTGKTMVFDTNATAEFRYPDKFTASKTTTYTATGDETIIPCDGTAASFTVTLPTAASAIGKRLAIIKTDSDATKVITLDGNGAETIDGSASLTITNQYESIEVASDGTSWHLMVRKILAATQAQMEAATATDVRVTPGRVVYHPGVCKAWCNFTGIGTTALSAAYNVASVADNGTGDTTITIGTDFSGSEYCSVCVGARNASPNDGIVCISAANPPTAGTIRVFSTNGGGSKEDFLIVCVAMFGDQ